MFKKKQIWCSANKGLQEDVGSLASNDNPRGLEASYRDQQTIRMIYYDFMLLGFPTTSLFSV